MPSEKSARSSERRRVRNRSIRSETRTMIAKAVVALRSGEPEVAGPAVSDAVRALDKAATKNVIHRNNSARKKSRLMAKLNSLKSS